MNAYGGVEVWLHAFLTLTPDGGKVSAVHLSRFIQERTRGAHWFQACNNRHFSAKPSNLQHCNIGLLISCH